MLRVPGAHVPPLLARGLAAFATFAVPFTTPSAAAPAPLPAQGSSPADVGRACEARDLEACLVLANLYREGKVTGWVESSDGDALHRAVAIDARRAHELSRAGCERGNAGACFNLALMYSYATGVPRDELRAARFGRKSCDGGYAPGCSELARFYWAGLGVTENKLKAARLYRSACEAGDAVGCYVLGICYRDGRGVRKDLAQTAHYWEQACAARSQYACDDLGLMYGTGGAVERNEAKAAELFRTVCDAGGGSGCYHLGGLYETGRGVPQDLNKAQELYQRGCDGHVRDSCVSLSKLTPSATPSSATGADRPIAGGGGGEDGEPAPRPPHAVLTKVATLGDTHGRHGERSFTFEDFNGDGLRDIFVITSETCHAVGCPGDLYLCQGDAAACAAGEYCYAGSGLEVLVASAEKKLKCEPSFHSIGDAD